MAAGHAQDAGGRPLLADRLRARRELGLDRPDSIRYAFRMVGRAIVSTTVILAFGFGVLAPYLPGTVPFLDLLDHIASDILLPLSGIAIALVAGWHWSPLAALREADLAPGLGAPWLWALRVLLPAAIALAMARGLGLL